MGKCTICDRYVPGFYGICDECLPIVEKENEEIEKNARAEEIGRLRVEIQSLKGLQNKAAELADAIDDHGFKDEVSSLHEMLVMFGALMRVNMADRRQKLKSLKEEEQ